MRIYGERVEGGISIRVPPPVFGRKSFIFFWIQRVYRRKVFITIELLAKYSNVRG
jgi:hypothetical protein